MRSALHILTRPAESLALEIIARQSRLPEVQVEVVDMTRPEIDYAPLLEKIFTADSIAVW